MPNLGTILADESLPNHGLDTQTLGNMIRYEMAAAGPNALLEALIGSSAGILIMGGMGVSLQANIGVAGYVGCMY